MQTVAKLGVFSVKSESVVEKVTMKHSTPSSIESDTIETEIQSEVDVSVRVIVPLSSL